MKYYRKILKIFKLIKENGPCYFNLDQIHSRSIILTDILNFYSFSITSSLRPVACDISEIDNPISFRFLAIKVLPSSRP